MRIAYFSPLPPLKSGISEYSELVIYELAKCADVDLWVDGYQPVDRIKTNFPIIDYLQYPEKLNSLSGYDAVIYNMGNNPDFHSNIFEVSQKSPGIVILHDYVLHHFFAGYWLDFKQKPQSYIREMLYNHGSQGEMLAKEIVNGFKMPVWETDEVIDYPLNKRAICNALGVIVHSNFVRERIEHIGVPMKKINHPYFKNEIVLKEVKRSELEIPPNKIVLFSLGDLTPNKGIDVVLNALASDSYLMENCFYICAGREKSDYNIRAKVKDLNLDNVVKLPGRVSMDMLYKYLTVADVCINLRFPTMGETSGSAIRMLQIGKPTLVTKIGWYDELPDDCVVKIDTSHNIAEIKDRLKCLVSDEKARYGIGINASKHIKEEFSVELFVENLLDFCKELSPKLPVCQLVNIVSKEIHDMGIGEDSRIIDLIAEELFFLS